MCARYTLTADAEWIQLAFDLGDVAGWLEPRCSIAPSQQIAVISNRAPRKLFFMKWGLVPSWAKDPKIGYRMINAARKQSGGKAVIPLEPFEVSTPVNSPANDNPELIMPVNARRQVLLWLFR